MQTITLVIDDEGKVHPSGDMEISVAIHVLQKLAIQTAIQQGLQQGINIGKQQITDELHALKDQLKEG